MENRGSGIDAMLAAMQKRGLPAPVFEDRGTSFLARFYQAKSVELTEEEQKVLAYVREKGSIKRAEARKLLGTNDAKAGYVLRKMMKAGLLRKEGSFKDSLYLLP